VVDGWEAAMAVVEMRTWRRMVAVLLPALGLLLAAGAAPAAEKTIQRLAAKPAAASDLDDDGLARVIVKYKAGSTLAAEGDGTPRHAQRLGRQLGLAMEDRHVLGQRTQSLRARGIGSVALAAKLAARADVEWAVPVRRKTITAALPNDPYFGANQATITPTVGQWYLRAPDSTFVSAINALGAWAITEGSSAVTVAVIDTGVRLDHPDLAGKLRAGYDFVSRTTTAADGGGRDADPSDPGDYSSASDSCGAGNSSWHGTQVAGLVGAASDNGIGMAGTGRNTMVLPVRALGKCGGFDDDIQAAMRWSAGLSNGAGCSSTSTATATCNPFPARVINLSLGSPGSCSTAYRTLVAELTAAGVSVVAAAGNGNGLAVNEPANCDGVIAVAGIRHAGTKVGYSNLGPEVSVAAPAGNCVNLSGACLYPLLTTDNDGTTTPGNNTYSSSSVPSLGTSFASPLVAGTVGLMLAVDPALTPSQIKATLRSSARAFPSTGAQEPATVACQPPSATEQIECYCTTGTCGQGMLDAGAAVTAVQAARLVPTAAITASTTTPTVGTAVVLGSTGSGATGGRTLAGFQWTLTSGAGLASLVGATDGSTATLATSGAGTVVVQLTVTDSSGATATTSQTITVAAAPVVVTPPTTVNDTSSGGGGGAMGAGWVLGLLAAAGLLRRRAPRPAVSATR
jgi:serine protease